MTEADTCRKFVVPLLRKAGWDNDPHSIAEQRYFTAGRMVAQGQTARRRPGDRDDYAKRSARPGQRLKACLTVTPRRRKRTAVES